MGMTKAEELLNNLNNSEPTKDDVVLFNLSLGVKELSDRKGIIEKAFEKYKDRIEAEILEGLFPEEYHKLINSENEELNVCLEKTHTTIFKVPSNLISPDICYYFNNSRFCLRYSEKDFGLREGDVKIYKKFMIICDRDIFSSLIFNFKATEFLVFSYHKFYEFSNRGLIEIYYTDNFPDKDNIISQVMALSGFSDYVDMTED
jgi:hypothetical protein